MAVISDNESELCLRRYCSLDFWRVVCSGSCPVESRCRNVLKDCEVQQLSSGTVEWLCGGNVLKDCDVQQLCSGAVEWLCGGNVLKDCEVQQLSSGTVEWLSGGNVSQK
jgi:hypothetical protein